jgi:hypothetical protein
MIDDDELLLYYYRDGLSPERLLAVETQLHSDPALHARWQQLQTQLADWIAPDWIAPDLALPEPLQKRMQEALASLSEGPIDRAKVATAAAPAWAWQWSTALAATVVLGLGILIGKQWQQSNPPAPLAVQATPAAAADQGFARSVQLHLLATQRGLLQVTQAKPSERATLVQSLLESNRLHSHLAARAGDAELARLLRSFDAILRQMGESSASAEDLAGRRAQLAFEVEVMQTKRQLAASKSAQSL